MAIHNAGVPGGRVDERLHQIRAAASGANETLASEGGFMLQPDFNDTLLQDMFAASVLAPRCRKNPFRPTQTGVNYPELTKLPGRPEADSEGSRVTGSLKADNSLHRSQNFDLSNWC